MELKSLPLAAAFPGLPWPSQAKQIVSFCTGGTSFIILLPDRDSQTYSGPSHLLSMT